MRVAFRRGIRVAVVAFAAGLAVTCIETGAVTCEDGAVCRDGTRCVPTTGPYACANDAQFDACDGLTDGSNCDVGGIPGTCFAGACVLEQCGDLILIRGEVCDDGNRAAGDGCSTDCRSMEICGDGYSDLAAGEQCDQQLKGLSGDGCTSKCSVEYRLWREVTPGVPDGRNFGAFVTDPAGGVLLFGGTSNAGANFNFGPSLSPAVPGFWKWDGVTWRELDPHALPPLRAGAAVAYDPRRNRVVLFGGFGSNSLLADTWEYDGLTWTQRIPAVSPSGRVGASFACNSSSCVMFAGNTGGSSANPDIVNDTWRWDGLAWTALNIVSSPPVRTGAAMAYDPAKQRYVLHGGFGCAAGSGSGSNCSMYSDISDTWELGATWVPASGSGTIPLASALYPTAASDDAQLLLVSGGGSGGGSSGGSNGVERSTYRSESAGWVDAAPAVVPPRTHAVMAHDKGRNKLVILGTEIGKLDAGVVAEWTTMPDRWTPTPPRAPSAGAAGAAYDQKRGRLVVVDDLAQTWDWDGRGWIQGPAAPGGTVPVLAYDAECGTTLAFGGLGTFPANETWSYNGMAWARVATTMGPDARIGHVLVYDATRKRIVLFGGRRSLSSADLDEVWEWGGTCGAKTWTQSHPAVAPPERAFSAAAFDPRRGVVLFSGSHLAAFRDDTWIWDGTTWTPVTSPFVPSPRDRHAMAYDPRRGRIVMTGGLSATGARDDTWEWDGETQAWQQVPVVIPAPRRANTVLSPDITGSLVILDGLATTQQTVKVYRLSSEQTLEAIERCTSSTEDADGDGLAGCADPDCFARCAPLCAPGTSCMGPSCGDTICSAVEDYLICPADCPAP